MQKQETYNMFDNPDYPVKSCVGLKKYIEAYLKEKLPNFKLQFELMASKEIGVRMFYVINNELLTLTFKTPGLSYLRKENINKEIDLLITKISTTDNTLTIII